MKHKYTILQFLLSIVFLLSYCCKGQNKLQYSDLIIDITTTEINLNNNFDLTQNENVTLKFELRNTTDRNYCIVVDTTRFFKYLDYNFNEYSKITQTNFDRQLFQFGIKIKRKTQMIDTGFSVVSNYFETLPKLERTVNENIVFIPKKSSIYFTKSFTLPIISNSKDKSEIIFVGNSIKTLSLNLFLFQDKNLIEKNLNDSNKKKIKMSNSKIFTGIIESNQIPVNLN